MDSHAGNPTEMDAETLRQQLLSNAELPPSSEHAPAQVLTVDSSGVLPSSWRTISSSGVMVLPGCSNNLLPYRTFQGVSKSFQSVSRSSQDDCPPVKMDFPTDAHHKREQQQKESQTEPAVSSGTPSSSYPRFITIPPSYPFDGDFSIRWTMQERIHDCCLSPSLYPSRYVKPSEIHDLSDRLARKLIAFDRAGGCSLPTKIISIGTRGYYIGNIIQQMLRRSANTTTSHWLVPVENLPSEELFLDELNSSIREEYYDAHRDGQGDSSEEVVLIVSDVFSKDNFDAVLNALNSRGFDNDEVNASSFLSSRLPRCVYSASIFFNYTKNQPMPTLHMQKISSPLIYCAESLTLRDIPNHDGLLSGRLGQKIPPDEDSCLCSSSSPCVNRIALHNYYLYSESSSLTWNDFHLQLKKRLGESLDPNLFSESSPPATTKNLTLPSSLVAAAAASSSSSLLRSNSSFLTRSGFSALLKTSF